MKQISSFWGQSRLWWLVLVVGILMVIAGFAYWFFPAIGYAVASVLFGWMLIAAGIVQLCVSAGENRPRGWGWWLAGGVIDMFIGFMLVRSVTLAEAVFPYFIAFVFIFWGIGALVGSINGRARKYWWLQLINGILLLLIGFFFMEAGYLQNMVNVSFLTSLAFIYWGFTLAMGAYDMKPAKTE
ncbi:MAG: DUF308 domain-containing protein [Bacteroides sp.]|nr:DUF308 domain-containing protein [Bacteroides sp.]MCM1379364.1 DUF308 domain-containing protein [Bacteroides sp.]MCM1445224.1 DUF308 domain-containing protein [Prevotella sp.]